MKRSLLSDALKGWGAWVIDAVEIHALVIAVDHEANAQREGVRKPIGKGGGNVS